ncbi:MAG TPA: TOBE domain-containing protein [Ilumatobacteraceae bacterium]|nr:TOBE domain-containing protein [Ilumatobacteraceae bacterium]
MPSPTGLLLSGRRTAFTPPKRLSNRECGTRMDLMSQIRVKDAAIYLGVSDDTLRRWIENGVLASSHDGSGRTVVDGLDLAQLARKNAVLPADPSEIGRSARNRFVGLVTEIISDTVMSQVELQCGPHRVVSLMSTEAVRELGLEPGSVAIAVVKATTVIVETP